MCDGEVRPSEMERVRRRRRARRRVRPKEQDEDQESRLSVLGAVSVGLIDEPFGRHANQAKRINTPLISVDIADKDENKQIVWSLFASNYSIFKCCSPRLHRAISLDYSTLRNSGLTLFKVSVHKESRRVVELRTVGESLIQPLEIVEDRKL